MFKDAALAINMVPLLDSARGLRGFWSGGAGEGGKRLGFRSWLRR